TPRSSRQSPEQAASRSKRGTRTHTTIYEHMFAYGRPRLQPRDFDLFRSLRSAGLVGSVGCGGVANASRRRAVSAGASTIGEWRTPASSSVWAPVRAAYVLGDLRASKI